MIELIEIDKLTLLENNPRRITKDQFEKLKKSLEEDPMFFKLRPCLVNKIGNDLIVYAGNQRVRAASKLKWCHVPCIVEENVSETRMKSRAIKDNKTFGEWDFDVLNEHFEIDLILDAGFTAEELTGDYTSIADLVSIDEEDDTTLSPKEDKDADTKLGDIYEMNDHRLICGDSTNVDFVKNILLMNNSIKIDMVYTDPPYGINEKTDRVKQSRGYSCKANNFNSIIGDKCTNTAILAYEICQNLNINTMIFWGANYYCHSLPESGNWLVWDKRVEENQKDVNSDCELAWIKSKNNSVRIFRHLWKGMCKASEIGEKRVHPTQKPIELAIWCISQYGDKCFNILDLFLGSGSTLIACEKLNRKCIGVELSPAYCDVIVERWKNFMIKNHRKYKILKNGLEI